MAKVFGTSNEREVKRLMPLVDQINTLEPAMKQLSDEQLRAKTDEFRQRIHDRVDSIEDVDEKAAALKEVLDEILPAAFAVAREGGWRVLKMRHFDVQLIGGIVLHHGKIAEIRCEQTCSRLLLFVWRLLGTQLFHRFPARRRKIVPRVAPIVTRRN